MNGQTDPKRTGDGVPLMVQCSSCGSIGYPADRYCACCGVAMPRRCGGCEAVILHRAANYCTQCGLRFRDGMGQIR